MPASTRRRRHSHSATVAATSAAGTTPYHFQGVTRVHARSLATQFLLQIGPSDASRMRRETSRVSFLMCPFCVRGQLLMSTTALWGTQISVRLSGIGVFAGKVRSCVRHGLVRHG